MDMGNLVPIISKDDNVISVTLIDGKLSMKPKVRYNKDGSIDKRHSNKLSGVSSEVYPFTTKEEIKAMIDLFDKRIEKAKTPTNIQIAHRNKMMFLIGLNLGIRASDLVSLRYSFFMNDDGTFKDGYKLQPKKTKKTGKFVTLYFNQTVKKAITDYIEKYPIQDLEGYLFKSKKSNNPITERALWKIISDAATEIGLKSNYGSHSLRKTFGFWIWHDAEDKDKTLVTLMKIFNHSSTQVTMKYIGLLDNEIEEVFNNLDLGFDYI